MPVNLAYHAYQLMWVGLDLLYPPECGGCEKIGARWCNDCKSQCQLIGETCCEICGDVNVSSMDVCHRCQYDQPVFVQARSWAIYRGPVRSALLKLKFRRDIGLGESLAKSLITDLIRINWPIDMVMPVPLSLARLAERGYNQAALIARPIALGLRIPYQPKGLNKIVDTRSQIGLSLRDRRANVDGAFCADAKLVAGKRILVVDDVTTSGATLNECAKALIDAGAREVFAYSVARAVFSSTIDLDIQLDESELQEIDTNIK